MMTRKDIARKTGLSPRIIQFYVDSGVVKPIENKDIRRGIAWEYNEQHLIQWRIIKKLIDCGITVRKMKKILENRSNDLVELEKIVNVFHDMFYCLIGAKGEKSWQE